MICAGCGLKHRSNVADPNGIGFHRAGKLPPYLLNVAGKLPRYKNLLNVSSELPSYRYARLFASWPRQVFAIVTLVVVTFLMILVGSLAASASSLTILYTNDIHDRLGSLAGLSKLIEQERSIGSPVLLFDSGVTWQDFRAPLYAVWGYDKMVDWMNSVKYDAMEIGNHDLYYGANRLVELSSRADFPILCANMIPFAGYKAPYSPYTMITAAGMRVLVIGVITVEYLSYPDYPWLRYVDPATAIQNVLTQMDGEYDFVIALGHLPVAQAVQIARAVPDIDVFLTGHSHEITPQPVKEGKTLILQAGAFGHYLGRLKLEIDPQSGKIISAHNSLIETKKTPVSLDRGYLKLFTVAALIATSLLLFFR